MDKTRRMKILEGWVRDQEILKARIDSGIELSRKSSLNVRVVDAAGKPVPGAKVTLKQKTHDFKYGANIFLLDELPDDERNQEYRRIFAELGKEVPLVVTGGLAKVVLPYCEHTAHYDDNLLLEGLRLIYEKNKK